MRIRAVKLRSLKRKYPIVGQVKDVDGDWWDVCDVRDTKYGFDLYFGIPDNDHGAYRGGLPRLIASNGLREFWQTNRINGGMLYDLPAGRSTLKRVRKRLGFHYLDDLTEFWTERVADLASLSPREFAARHEVEVEVAFDRRRKMVGRRAREIGWWRTPKTCEILLSKLSLSQVGRNLGISISHSKRLRDRANQESH